MGAVAGQRLPKRIGAHQKAPQAALQEALLDPAGVPDAAENLVPRGNKELRTRLHRPRLQLLYVLCPDMLS